MPLDIARAIGDGFERTIARNGVLFAAIFFAMSVLDALFSTGMGQQFVPPDQFGGPGMGPLPGGAMEPSAPSLGLSPVVAGLLSFVLGIVALIVTIAAIRTFVSEETEEIPGESYSQNLLWPAVNVVVGSIIFGIAVAIGFVLLIIPGLFLLVSLVFWEVYVVIEGENFVEGFRHSWSLTSGHRLRLFGLGVLVVVIAIAVSFVFGIPDLLLPNVVGFLFAQVGSAFVSVFFIATLAQTYNQLLAMESGQVETEPA